MQIPTHIGPCEFGALGKLIAVRCPHDYDAVMHRRWLIERRRINPVIRTLRQTVDPLFHYAGVILEV